MITFTLSDKQEQRVKDWLNNTVYPAIIEKQKAEYTNVSENILYCWAMGQPYEGASGGGLTYEFTPTSLGVVEIVRYSTYTLDITEYGEW